MLTLDWSRCQRNLGHNPSCIDSPIDCGRAPGARCSNADWTSTSCDVPARDYYYSSCWLLGASHPSAHGPSLKLNKKYISYIQTRQRKYLHMCTKKKHTQIGKTRVRSPFLACFAVAVRHTEGGLKLSEYACTQYECVSKQELFYLEDKRCARLVRKPGTPHNLVTQRHNRVHTVFL